MKWLFGLFVGAAAFLLHGEDFYSFASFEKLYIRFAEQGQFGEIAELDGKKALQLNWNGTEAKWCEFGVEPVSRPIEKPGEFTLAVQVHIGAECTADTLMLRLIDREGETFQFPMPLGEKKKTGWRTVNFSINPDHPARQSWGKNPNRKYDFPLRLVGGVVAYNGPGCSSIGLGEVRLQDTGNTAATALCAVLETGLPINVVTPGNRAQTGIRVRNDGARTENSSLKYELLDRRDRIIASDSIPVTALKPGETSFIPLPLPAEYGLYRIRFAFGEKEVPQVPNATFAYLDPAGPSSLKSGEFQFGMCDHCDGMNTQDRENTIMAAAYIGVEAMRDGPGWGWLEPEPGKWNFRNMDNLCAAFERWHIKYQPIISWVGLPWQKTRAPWTPRDSAAVRLENSPPDLEAYAEYVRTIASRYRGRLDSVLIWNEPDLTTFCNFSPELFAEVMRTACKAAKEGDPDVRVFSPGFASPQHDYTLKCVDLLKNDCDVFSIHCHGDFPGYVSDLNLFLDARKKYGNAKPWFSNETGISSIGTVSAMTQAEVLFKKMLYAWASGAAGYKWYNLREKGTDPNNIEHHYGIMTRDFQPKEAYLAYNTLARFFKDGRFLGREGSDDRLFVYSFRSRGDQLLVPFWSLENKDTLLILSGITGKTFLVDLFGNETPQESTNGNLVIRVGQTPQFLRIEQREKIAVVGKLLELQNDFLLFKDTPSLVALKFMNPTDRPLPCNVKPGIPNNYSCDRSSLEFVIPPRGTTVQTFQITAGKTDADSKLKLELNAGSLWRGTAEIDLKCAIAIPAGEYASQCVFKAANHSQVTVLVPFVPEAQHLHWSGPEDCSVTVFPAVGRHCLKLKAVVSDDRHVPDGLGADIWKGDSVQLALSLPRQSTFWILGFAGDGTGPASAYVWNAPQGYSAARTASLLRGTVKRNEAAKTMVYEMEIPFHSVGLTDSLLKEGIRFNLLVNDNDGDRRESFISLAPGLGYRNDDSRYPVISH